MTKQPNKPQATDLLSQAEEWAEKQAKEKTDTMHNLRVEMRVPDNGQKLTDGWRRHECGVSGYTFEVPDSYPILYLVFDMEWGDEPGELNTGGHGRKINPKIAVKGPEGIKEAMLALAERERNKAAFALQEANMLERAAELAIAVEWPSYWKADKDDALQLVR